MTQLAIADLFLRETGNCIFTTNVQQIFASQTREEEEEEDRMAAESPGRPEEDRMVAESPGRPEEDRMVAESPGRPEEDRMAAESPGRPPSRGEEDQETLRMIADLGEAPGIEQLVEQSPIPKKISIR